MILLFRCFLALLVLVFGLIGLPCVWVAMGLLEWYEKMGRES